MSTKPSTSSHRPEGRFPPWPVPHVWQLDPAHDLPGDERRTCCAVATVKMVADFWQTGIEPGIRPGIVRAGLLRHGGRDSRGHWFHAAEVGFLTSLGLVAWRRNWSARGTDSGWLVRHERYTPAQQDALERQTEREQHSPPGDRPAWTLLQALLEGPVIASVMPGFSANRQNHQVVLCGWRRIDQRIRLSYLDPLLPRSPGSSAAEVDFARFLDRFNRRAIFARPADGRPPHPE